MSGATPGPWSLTSSTAAPALRHRVTVMTSPAGEYLSALSTRLETSTVSSSSSPTSMHCGSRSIAKRSGVSANLATVSRTNSSSINGRFCSCGSGLSRWLRTKNRCSNSLMRPTARRMRSCRRSMSGSLGVNSCSDCTEPSIIASGVLSSCDSMAKNSVCCCRTWCLWCISLCAATVSCLSALNRAPTTMCNAMAVPREEICRP